MLDEYLKKYAKLVENELEKFFKKKLESVDIDDEIKRMVDVIREYTMRGGKRLRPVLTIVSYKLYGGKNEGEIIKASGSLELIQSYLLIHDDIIDESDLRRGKPTVHKIYSYNGEKFGRDMAIIAGDLASMYAQEILSTSNFNKEDLVNALYKLSEIVEYTGYGQILDVLSSYRDNFSEDDLLKLHTYKTAKYTIEGPMIIGSMLAGNYDFRMISEYSIPVGIAFQLQDDVLGLFGNEIEIGKPVTSDLEEGKKTLLILKASENENYRNIIGEILGKKNINMEELEKVRKIVRDSGALEYTQKMAEDLVKKGINALGKIDSDEKQFLKEFAEWVIKRKF